MTVRWSGSGVISTFFTAPPLVISAAGRGSEKVTLHAAVTIEAGDLSTQRFNRDRYHFPITACSPARDDDGGTRLRRHFDRSKLATRSQLQAAYSTAIEKVCDGMINISSQTFFISFSGLH